MVLCKGHRFAYLKQATLDGDVDQLSYEVAT